MSKLETAIGDVLAWSRGERGEALPEAASGLAEIVATGLGGLGTHLPSVGARGIDGAWVGRLYACVERQARRAARSEAPFRLRIPAGHVREHGDYHLGVVAREVGPVGVIEQAWRAGPPPILRVSFGELLSHLARSFALHGRVPHVGEAGRALVPDLFEHGAATPYAPTRPPYRYAGDGMAEVQLNFGLPIFVDTADDSVAPDIIRTAWWEPWIDGVVRRTVGPGDVVVNVGANVGYHALLMARCVESTGRVLAFEPNPRLVRLLRRSLTWGGLLGMTTLLPFAAAATRGTLRFAFNPLNLGNGQFASDRAQRELIDATQAALLEPADGEALIAARRPKLVDIDVHCTTLDATVGRMVPEAHFLLIDVEGAEIDVLAGARELIQRSPDIAMIVEWSHTTSYVRSPEQRRKLEDMVAWLRQGGFCFWHIAPDARDHYVRPAMLTPMTVDDVLGMERYADLYISRR